LSLMMGTDPEDESEAPQETWEEKRDAKAAARLDQRNAHMKELMKRSPVQRFERQPLRREKQQKEEKEKLYEAPSPAVKAHREAREKARKLDRAALSKLRTMVDQTDGDESKGSAPAGGAVDALAEQERRLLQRMNRPRRGLDGKIVGGGSAAGFSPL